MTNVDMTDPHTLDDIQRLISKYDLAPHPEGGYYREIYRSDMTIHSPGAGADRNAATHIYFMLTAGQISRFHRVTHDELWHFYQGSALTLTIYENGRIDTKTIGPGKEFMAVVPAGAWQAAVSQGEYSIVGCTVAPGFDFNDFSFLADHPDDLKKLRSTAPHLARFF